MDKLVIRGAVIIDPQQETISSEPNDLLVIDGRVEAVGGPFPAEDKRILEAQGLCCAPGLVDMHVHLRDPGQTEKEDILSGCCAAAAGGVTSLACMPNTSPACDSPEILREILEKAKKASARVYPVAAITRSLAGEELTDFEQLKNGGAVALSDDGRPVSTAGRMMDAMRRAAAAGLPVLSHCEELSLTRGGIMNEGEVSRLLGVPGLHPAAEETATAREIALAAAVNCPVHICHVSTRGSVALLRDARRRGVPVTGETAPHYFSLTDELLRRRDADYRMNPPLRTPEDVEAVIEGLCDGTLSAIATDHAPHTLEDKADFLRAPNGSVGMETSLAVGITFLVRTGCLTLARLIRLMSSSPAELLGIPGGSLQRGAPADLVLFDPDEPWTVEPGRLHGKSQNCPFKGMKLYGRVKATLLEGQLVYTD
ncbi:MAG: dihydroorotase [Clostridiales bacterium]|nr:dihydroorotase [Clostridiales bacterium]